MKFVPFRPCSDLRAAVWRTGQDAIPADASHTRGFTLFEMTIVLAIVGFLLGAVLMPLATQFEVRKNRETERMLREIQQALHGFAIVNGRLPCPDVETDPGELPAPAVDGQEDCESVTAGVDEGYLPWVALQLRPTDSWGHLFYYRVTPEFTYPTVAGAPAGAGQLDLEDVGDIEVRTRGDNPATGSGGEGKELVEQVPDRNYLELWQACFTSPDILISHFSRYYLRYDITREDSIRLSPSILRDFLSFTLFSTVSQREKVIDRQVTLSNHHRQVSMQKMRIARGILRQIMRKIPQDLHHIMCAFIAGDIAYFLAHREPREVAAIAGPRSFRRHRCRRRQCS